MVRKPYQLTPGGLASLRVTAQRVSKSGEVINLKGPTLTQDADT